MQEPPPFDREMMEKRLNFTTQGPFVGTAALFPSCSPKEWDSQHSLERQRRLPPAWLGWQQPICGVSDSQLPSRAPECFPFSPLMKTLPSLSSHIAFQRFLRSGCCSTGSFVIYETLSGLITPSAPSVT